MDTPEKDNFLETIRELKKEADEKLTGNRHYLAIQRLDEIAEAVQQRDMSSAELGAVSEVLRGDINEAPVSVTHEPDADGDEKIDLVAPALGVAGIAAVGVVADAVIPEEPVTDALDPQNITPDDNQTLPNWWKDKDGGGADGESMAAQADIEPEIEIVPESVSESVPQSNMENVEESGLDLTSVAAGAAVSGVAAAMVTDQLSSDTVEIVEEIELIDIPEVEIEADDGDLSAIDIEAIEPEIDLPDVGEIEIPEEVLEVAPVIEVPEIEPEVEIVEVPESIEIEAIPEIELEPVELLVEEVPEMAPAEIAMPEVEIAAIPAVPVPDASAQIANLLSDVNVDTQAVVAAGAAAAAIGAAGIVMKEEPTEPEAVEHLTKPSEEVVEAPEKLSFPSVPNTNEQVEVEAELVTALPAAAILNGDNISRHPTYGGSRGGILKRFVNSLRGKDYI